MGEQATKAAPPSFRIGDYVRMADSPMDPPGEIVNSDLETDEDDPHSRFQVRFCKPGEREPFLIWLRAAEITFDPPWLVEQLGTLRQVEDAGQADLREFKLKELVVVAAMASNALQREIAAVAAKNGGQLNAAEMAPLVSKAQRVGANMNAACEALRTFRGKS